MEVELIKVPAKLGCDGCWYDNRPDCPAFKDENGKWNFTCCTDEDGNQLIFVPQDGENENEE